MSNEPKNQSAADIFVSFLVLSQKSKFVPSLTLPEAQWLVALQRENDNQDATWLGGTIDVSGKTTGYTSTREFFGCDDAYCYSELLREAQGRYVCLTTDAVKYSPNTLEALQLAGELRAPVVRIEVHKHGDDQLTGDCACKTIDLDQDPHAFEMFPPCYFFEREFLLRIFDETDLARGCAAEAAFYALIETLLRCDGRFKKIEGAFCTHTKAMTRTSKSYYLKNDPSWYLSSLEGGYLPFFDTRENGSSVPAWLCEALYYQLYFKIYSNLNARDTFCVAHEDIPRMQAAAKQIVSAVSDELILGNGGHERFRPPFRMRLLFLHLKHGEALKSNLLFQLEQEKLIARIGNAFYDCSQQHELLEILAFNVDHSDLIVDASLFCWELLGWDQAELVVTFDNQGLPTRELGIYSLSKVFGVAYEKKYVFQVKLPLRNLIDGASHRVGFSLQTKDGAFKLPLKFSRTAAKLSNFGTNSYWMLSPVCMMTYEEGEIVFRHATKRDAVRQERLFQKEIKAEAQRIYSEKRAREVLQSVLPVRKAYWRAVRRSLRRGGLQRNTWLYFDKLYKGGDNGEYLFRYCSRQNDGKKHYYIVNRDAPEYARLSGEGLKTLAYGSFECKLQSLLAENIVATHPDIIEFCGFTKYEKRFVRDIFNPNLICIAHGITIQKNADYQNRLYDNTMFYTTTSQYEVQHILSPVYGYQSDQVALTGLARFDGLASKDIRQILITPTWRRTVVGSANRNSTRRYSKRFKQSSYYQVYNRLINDEQLIDAAKRHGYRILFLLHPAMSAQIEDYETNDYVSILAATDDVSYERILTESSLMITDYSGIQYDFAYMRKPVIYYQPPSIPMRFEEGAMKFATMGFGPICTTHDEVVGEICACIERECKMEDEYRRRADDFFEFDDHKNCERIYRALYDWSEERRNIHSQLGWS